MKTWEMIKELSENPKKKFKRKTDGLEIRSMCGRFNWEPGYTFLGVNDEWEEVRQPVDFMTAMEEIKDEISVEYDGVVVEFKKIDEMLYFLGKHYTDTFIRSLILNGKWYIED